MYRKLFTLKFKSTKPITSILFKRLAIKRMDGDNGVPLKQVVNVLENFAGSSLAASWDNVGLLVEPTTPKLVSHILLTNDLTEVVMQEAIEMKTDLIISYHPPIFMPLKSITTGKWKERIIAACLENKIAIYSPHTSFDSVKGGVNDWLAAAFCEVIENSKPIQPDVNINNGMGRLCTLTKSVHIDDAVQMIKRHTGLEFVRLARVPGSGSLISTVAVCAGSGSSVLKEVPADLYVTGEMLHHDILDAIHNGTNVILTNHSDSERGYLKIFALTLTNLLGNVVEISVSKRDADPLKTV